MILFGIMGWAFRKMEIPTVPVILGILLGYQMENNLRHAMTLSGGEWTYLFASPISIGLWIFAVLGFVAPMFLRRMLKKPPMPETQD